MINANIKQVHETFGAYQAHINTKFKHTSERYGCGQYRSIRKEKQFICQIHSKEMHRITHFIQAVFEM